MKTDELIRELSRNHGPVNRVPKASTRLTIWFGVAAALTILMIAGIRLRTPQLLPGEGHPFYFETLSALLCALLAAAAALYTSIPGERLSLLPWGVALAVTGWIGSIGIRWGSAHWSLDMPTFSEMNCGRDILIGGFLSSGILIGMIKRAAPVSPVLTGLLGALASSLLAIVALQFFCPVQSPSHLLTCHIAPAAVVTMAGMIAGRLILAW